jgi:hypothetical protein
MTRGTVTKVLTELGLLRLTKVVFRVVDGAMQCIMFCKIKTYACLVVLRHLGGVAACFSLSMIVESIETSCFRSDVAQRDLWTRRSISVLKKWE